MKIKFKFIIALAILCNYSFAKELSLNELIKTALENNISISIAKLNAQNKEATIDVAKSSYLPNISATGEVANYDLDNASVNGNGGVQSVSLTASQLIYDFGKTLNNIDASKENFEASLNEIVTTTSKTVLDVKVAYYNILTQYKLIEVAKESVKIDELQLNQAEEFFKAGIKTKIDVTNAQLQLSNSKLQLLKSEYNLKTAKAKFITLLGKEDIRKSFLVKKESKEIDSLSKQILSKNSFDLDNLIQKAFDNRAEILIKKSLVNYQRELYGSSKGDYFPTINAQGNYYNSEADNEVSSLESTQYSVGIYLKWDIFSGFRTKANRVQTLAQLNSAKENLKLQELSIVEEVTTSFYNVQESIDSLKISTLNVELANQNLELAQARYLNGLNDIVELNDAKLKFIEAKNELVNNYYSYKITTANLDYVSGIIINN